MSHPQTKQDTYQKRVVVITSAPVSQSQGAVLYSDQVQRLRNHIDSDGKVRGLRFDPPKFMEPDRRPGMVFPPDHLRIPARECYMGGSAFATTGRNVDALRTHGAVVDWFLISPVYGLVNADAKIWPYLHFLDTNTPPIGLQSSLSDVLNPQTFSDSGDKGDGRSGLRYDYDVALVAIAPEMAKIVDVGSFQMQRAFGRAFYFCDPTERAVAAMWHVETGERAEVPNRFESLALSLGVEVPRFLARCTYSDREIVPRG